MINAQKLNLKQRQAIIRLTSKYQFHNPKTGYLDFKPETPQIVLRMYREWMDSIKL